MSDSLTGLGEDACKLAALAVYIARMAGVAPETIERVVEPMLQKENSSAIKDIRCDLKLSTCLLELAILEVEFRRLLDISGSKRV